MKLQSIISQYIIYQKSLGKKFLSSEHVLKGFIRFMGPNKNLYDIQSKDIDIYLTVNGAITNSWHYKHRVLSSFYHYLLSRDFAKTSPLPIIIPKKLPYLVPYIYNAKELRALFDASLTYQERLSFLDPNMIRTLLLLLYGAGLRISEAINLTLTDIDLSQALITIRETKFNKSRFIPLGRQLTKSLSQYALKRHRDRHSQSPESPFFVGRNGKIVKQGSFRRAFRLILKKANIRRTDNSRYQPRLHDLRHTFAVHRLTAWYKKGADVQKMLPILSVYLGHVHLDGTAIYLTMTPALLEEAGSRFQHYAFKEESHD